jgi:hypothetical protein
MIANRPLVQGEDDFIHHINDLVSTMAKNDYTSRGGSQINTFIEKHVVGKPGSLIHVCIPGDILHVVV